MPGQLTQAMLQAVNYRHRLRRLKQSASAQDRFLNRAHNFSQLIFDEFNRMHGMCSEGPLGFNTGTDGRSFHFSYYPHGGLTHKLAVRKFRNDRIHLVRENCGATRTTRSILKTYAADANVRTVMMDLSNAFEKIALPRDWDSYVIAVERAAMQSNPQTQTDAYKARRKMGVG